MKEGAPARSKLQGYKRLVLALAFSALPSLLPLTFPKAGVQACCHCLLGYGFKDSLYFFSVKKRSNSISYDIAECTQTVLSATMILRIAYTVNIFCTLFVLFIRFFKYGTI